ncbi:uncharacterized protein LOC117117954 isoform X2 [Anneissia japonica]|uniref:uncharacterized protein LOC117117954 isoform X2 n=1 Tax=Anneissia japonica TaxID=1529436 RepID=UPI00142556BB|nr:uncharacterized protein LOC117117954 isoform X2 [Anneissia japonica]
MWLGLHKCQLDQVYVEFDGQDWEKRDWVKVHEETNLVFLVEKTIVWCKRSDPYSTRGASILWPALNFEVIEDKLGLESSGLNPIEFFHDRTRAFPTALQIHPFEDEHNKKIHSTFQRYTEVKNEVDQWIHDQKVQQILITAPYIVTGYRVKVYRIGSATQWFSAVITGHNLETRELIVMDDTVLESHTENPALVQMMFLDLDDVVVKSLLKGENVGITPRRRLTATSNTQAINTTTLIRSVPRSHSPSHANSNQNSTSSAKKKRGQKQLDEKDMEKEKQPEKLTKETKVSTNAKTKKEQRKKKAEEEKLIESVNKKEAASVKHPRSHSTSSEVQEEDKRTDKQTVIKQEKLSEKSKSRNKSSKKTEELQTNTEEFEIDSNLALLKKEKEKPKEKKSKSKHKIKAKERTGDRIKPAKTEKEEKKYITVEDNLVDNTIPQDTQKTLDTAQVESVVAIEPQKIERVENPLAETFDVPELKAKETEPTPEILPKVSSCEDISSVCATSSMVHSTSTTEINESTSPWIGQVKQREHNKSGRAELGYMSTGIEHIKKPSNEVLQNLNVVAMNPSTRLSPDTRTDQTSAVSMEKMDGNKPKERDKPIEKRTQQEIERDDARDLRREPPRTQSTESNRSSLATEVKEPVHVYRDPNLMENYVIHVDSVQHQHIHRGEHTPSPSRSLGPSPHTSLRPQPGSIGTTPSAFAPQPVAHHPAAHHHTNHPVAAAHHLYAQYGLYPHLPGIPPHYSPHLSALDPSFHTRLLTDLAAQKDQFRFHPGQLSVLQRPMMGVQPGLAMLLPQHRALQESMEHQLRLQQQHQQQQQQQIQHQQQQQQHLQHSNPPSHEPLKRYQEFQTNTSDPKAAVQQHFQESLRNLSLPFNIAQSSKSGGSITRGTPAQRMDASPARNPSEHPSKDDKRVQEEMKRKELEEKEREWQKLQREKEHRERAQSEREGYAGLLTQSETQHMRQYMSQDGHKPGEGHFHPQRPSSSSSEPKGFQVYQPHLKSEPSHQPSGYYPSGQRSEEFQQVVYPKLGHLNLSHKQENSEFMKGYQPFGHTLLTAPQNPDIDHRLSVTDSRFESGFRHTDAYSKLASAKGGKDIGGPPPLIRSDRDSRAKESHPSIPFGLERPGERKHNLEAYSRYHHENQYHYQQYGGHVRGSDGKGDSTRHQQSAPQGKGVPVICKTPSSHLSSESPSPHHQQTLMVKTSSSQPQSPLKVASPQQLSAAVFKPMDLSQAKTVTTSTTSQSAATQGHASLLMSALRPNERGELVGKRKTPMEEFAGHKKARGKDGQASPPLGPLGHPDRRPSAHPHHSYLNQYNWFVQDHRNNLVTGGRAAELLAKDLRTGRKEDVELKIEKVDQFENATNLNASSLAANISGKSDHPKINGAISDSDSTSTRSTSPSEKSKRCDPHTSPSKSAGHVSLKKAWLHRHTYTKDSLSEPSDPKLMRFSDGSSDSPGPTSLHNGHVAPTELDKKLDVDIKTSCTRLTDIPDAIPDRVYDFETSSTCSDGSTVSNSTKKKSRKSKESKKPKRKGGSEKETLSKDQNTQDDQKDTAKDVKENGILQRDPATMAPKKFIQTRARKERSKSDALNITRALVKPPIAKLKKSGEAFLQDGSCCDVTPNLIKCRECRMKPSSRHSKLNIFCRFYAFRRLKYSRNSNLMIAGFSEPCHCEQEDLDPWLPYTDPDCPLDVNTSKYILSKVGDQFCDLVQQEREAKAISIEKGKIAWKRAVTGVREMCDTCDTTLFNIHWTCPKCGFVVCLDCYKSRKNRCEEGDHDEKSPQRWLKCIKDQEHLIENLMLTQIIPKDALWDVGELVHKMRIKWNVNPNCKCMKNGKVAINGASQNLLAETVLTGPKLKPKDNKKDVTAVKNSNASSLQILADIATSAQTDNQAGDASSIENQSLQDTKTSTTTTDKLSCRDTPSTLRELLTKTADKLAKPAATVSSGSLLSAYFLKGENNSGKRMVTGTFEDIIASVVEQNIASPTLNKQERNTVNQTKQSRNANIQTMEPTAMFINPNLNPEDGQVRHTLVESSMTFPDVPHSWLCDGRLLRLLDPRHKGNLKIFQEQWRRGEPILVSGCHKVLSRKLWHPSTFSRMFGDQENDLVNCRSSAVIQGVPMKEFWDGFEDIRKRLVKQRDPMVLKLKDWPPAEDFSELLPDHFSDLMQGLPLPEYTHRNGHLNLSSRLPEFFVKPDLGPKMYNAYGSAKFPKIGTTNLHLDISDAVNVMVYVGIPVNENKGKLSHVDFEKDAFDAIDQSTCDELTKKRVRDKTERPGALWHIFRAVDADKIRDMLRKVSKEQGEEFPSDHDPIHDQSFYLDKKLLDRLKKDYGVQGWAIVQCMGDAVFIPAGAPHQVHNLHSCIKTAEDFVSPEHVHQCFKLTQEFRYLSSTHSNHEDKLQVKNIIYHAIKDTVGILMANEPPSK